MHTLLKRSPGYRLLLVLVLSVAFGAFSAARGAVITYTADLSGPAESPPNASPATGIATVEIDAVAHTMHVAVVFSDLVGTTAASHIHAPTATALTGTAGVATTLPTFAGFPLGVTSGTYDMTLDMTLPSSYNPVFVTNNGGTTALAEAALFQAIADGKAYLNIHTSFAAGGEIRGFLQLSQPSPVDASTWGRVKALYR
jgi:CHRD domain